MDETLAVRRPGMQFAERPDRLAGKFQAGLRIPGGVVPALAQRWSGRVDDGEEVQFARVALRRLEGFQDPRRPGAFGEALQGFPFAAGLRFGPPFLGGEVVEMQHRPLLRGRSDALEHPMEPLLRRRLEFQVPVAAEAAQRAIDRHVALRRQAPAQGVDFPAGEDRPPLAPEGAPPIPQPVNRDAVDDLARDLRGPGVRAGQQHGPFDAFQPVQHAFAEGRADQRGLHREFLRFAVDEARLPAEPGGVPVLDLDEAHARGPDRHDVDLQRSALAAGREQEVRQQQPLAGARHGLQAALDARQGQALAVGDGRFAGDVDGLHAGRIGRAFSHAAESAPGPKRGGPPPSGHGERKTPERYPSNPPACSKAWPRLSIVGSRKWSTRICMPIGSPAALRPHGTLMPAMPARLPVMV